MKLGIIGAGTVGTANKLGFEHIGHKVVSHDIKLDTKITIIVAVSMLYNYLN